jgi:flagellin-like hook-associated protein FlgL
MAETLVHFSMQQAVYQSALKSGAQIIQPSLMDFLR